MAKFKILTLEVKQISKGPNKGNEYVIGSLSNTLSPWSKPTTITIFDTQQIAYLKEFIPKKNGGNLDNDKLELPTELQYMNGSMFTYIPPKEQRPFIRVYTTTDTSRGWVAGEPIVDRKTGKPRLYEEIRVFCRYYIDPEMGTELQFDAGESPNEKGQAQFDAFFMSYNDYLEKKGVPRPEQAAAASIDDELDTDIPPVNAEPTNVLTDPASGKKYVVENGAIKWL